MTCWRRLRDWQQSGVWEKLRQMLPAELYAGDQLDWSKAVIDSSPVRVLKGTSDHQSPGRCFCPL
jgi:hypothetical protein